MLHTDFGSSPRYGCQLTLRTIGHAFQMDEGFLHRRQCHHGRTGNREFSVDHAYGRDLGQERPRVGKQQVFDPQTEATLSDVSVRRFGDTVILTGTLHSKSAKESFLSSTTVVFATKG